MCKILVRGDLAPLNGSDPIANLQLAQTGDLIVAVPDDHLFGKEEKPPLFEIISVPDMSVEEAMKLCVPARDVLSPTGDIVKHAPRHAISLDYNAHGKTLTRDTLLAAIKHNALIDNPKIIGQSVYEIG